MMNKSFRGPTRFLNWWAHTVYQSSLLIVITAFLLTSGIFYYTINNLGINTNVDDMISRDLPFRQTYSKYQSAFPQHIGVIVIVVEADTPEFTNEAAKLLVDRINKEKDFFIDAYLPTGGKFIEEHSLLYLSFDELENLTNKVAKVQPALVSLYQDMSLRGLFTMLESAVKHMDEDPEIKLKPLLLNINNALEANIKGQPFRLSWQELMKNERPYTDNRRSIIIARPHFDYSKLFPAQDSMSKVRSIGNELESKYNWGIRIRITGNAALGHDEMKSLIGGTSKVGVFTIVVVCLSLFIGLRSLPMVITTIISLVMGIIITAGFAAISVGHLNLISIAFAVLYLGLGVDYAIHLCLRFRELILDGIPKEESLVRSIVDISPSLTMCTLSTAIGFYSFIPTAYAGVSELGLISGTGMFINLLINLTVLPALLKIMISHKGLMQMRASGQTGLTKRKSFISRQGNWIRWSSLFFIIGSILLLQKIQFEFDPIKLRDPNTESVSTIIDIIESSDRHPSSIIALRSDDGSTRETVSTLGDLKTVDRVVSIHSFVPDDQEEKLYLIEDLDLILGPSFLNTVQTPPPSYDEQIIQIRSFMDKLENQTKITVTEELSRMSQLLNQWLTILNTDRRDEAKHRLSRFQKSLLETFPFLLGTLKTALLSEPFGKEDLPKDLFSRWVSTDDQYRIQIFAREDISKNDKLARFISDVRSVAPDATSGPVFVYEAGNAILDSFKQAFLLAFLFITILLFIILRNPFDPLLVLIPLIVAGVFTGAFTIILGIPFNFANIIALPLLLGLGVDNGIHMVYRMRYINPNNQDFLQSSTARGVFFSAITTILSFGALIFLSHQGTSSLGRLLTLGILSIMVTTLIILPAFYTLLKFRQTEERE